MRNALSDVAKKEGIDDSPQSIFAFLIERVRANLHVVLCMSPLESPSGKNILCFINRNLKVHGLVKTYVEPLKNSSELKIKWGIEDNSKNFSYFSVKTVLMRRF